MKQLKQFSGYESCQRGFFWFECKEIWIEGLRSYFLDWWNCLDVMVLSMYLASFALRVVIMLKVHFLCQLPDKQEECVYFTETCEKKYFTLTI